MAWPKGRPRKQPKPAQQIAPETPEDRAGDTNAVGVDFDLSAVRRRICAHYVRLETIPRDIRVHNYLPLSRIAAGIRRRMAKDGAPDSEVEAYVAKHVR